MLSKNSRKNAQTVESIAAEADSFGITMVNYKGFKSIESEWSCKEFGHPFTKDWKYLKKHKKCTVCSKIKKKIPTEVVLQDILSRGYELQSEYVNSTTPMTLLCPNGHTYKVTYKCFKDFDCDQCSRLDFEQMKLDAVNLYNTTIISNEFISSKHKLWFQCNGGHPPYEALWSTIKRSGCRLCNYERKLKGVDEVMAKITSLGWKLETSIVYEGRMSPISVKCEKNHPFTTNWQKMLIGNGCPTCFAMEHRWTYLEAASYFQLHDYNLKYDEALQTSFIDTHLDLLQAVCPVGHLYPTTFFNFSHNFSRCTTCNPPGTSAPEQDLLKVVQDMGVTAVNRHKVEGVEVDIFIPEHNLAIEYCGLYYHSSGICHAANKTTPEKIPAALRRNRTKHRDKYLHCKEHGIRLITIFADEWENQREKIVNRLRHFFGLSEKVAARQCKLIYIEKKIAYDFLETWHLQGSIPSKYTFGLFHDEELVGVLALGTPSRPHTSQGYEIKRMAFSKAVVGGSSKLIKRAIEKTKEDGKPELVSFCDLRWGNGGCYAQSGFVLHHESDPSPHMVSHSERIHYQNFTGDNKDKKKFYWELYDCGHQKWIYRIDTTT